MQTSFIEPACVKMVWKSFYDGAINKHAMRYMMKYISMAEKRGELRCYQKYMKTF